jgi:hypothetical protein
VEVVTDKAKLAGHSRPKVSSLANRGLRIGPGISWLPREGEGCTLGVFRGHPPRDGRALGAVRGPPAGAPRARPVWMTLEMTEEYKHKRRTMGRAT